MNTRYTTQTEIREAFWEQHPEFEDRRKRRVRDGASETGTPRYRKATQNDQVCDIRAAFVEFVEYLRRDGTITEELAGRTTL